MCLIRQLIVFLVSPIAIALFFIWINGICDKIGLNETGVFAYKQFCLACVDSVADVSAAYGSLSNLLASQMYKYELRHPTTCWLCGWCVCSLLVHCCCSCSCRRDAYRRALQSCTSAKLIRFVGRNINRIKLEHQWSQTGGTPRASTSKLSILFIKQLFLSLVNVPKLCIIQKIKHAFVRAALGVVLVCKPRWWQGVTKRIEWHIRLSFAHTLSGTYLAVAHTYLTEYTLVWENKWYMPCGMCACVYALLNNVEPAEKWLGLRGRWWYQTCDYIMHMYMCFETASPLKIIQCPLESRVREF